MVAGQDVGQLNLSFFLEEVMAFLQKTGRGIHHICYEVEGIDGLLETLKERGFKLIDEKPKEGSRGSRIAYVEAASPMGVYTEFCEFPR